MRHLYVVIDCSRSMEDQDLKPNRLTSTLKVTVVTEAWCCTAAVFDCLLFVSFSLSFRLQLMEGFVAEYFDQNPISQVRSRHGSEDHLSLLEMSESLFWTYPNS